MLRLQSGQDGEESSDGALVAQMAQRVLHDAEVSETPCVERYKIVIEACPGCGDACGRHDHIDATHVGQALCDAEVQEGRQGPSLGHVSRRIPPAVRRAVVQRDRGRCLVPGCHNRLWLDLHHLRPRTLGGPHSLENLVCLCGSHHRAIHDGVMGAEPMPGGARFWFKPGRIEQVVFRRLG